MAFRRRALPLAATLGGAGIGGWLYLVDAGRSLAGAGAVPDPDLAVPTLLWHVAGFGALGLLFSLTRRPFRLLYLSSIAFLGAMAANVYLLPAWSSPTSLAVDAVVLAAAGALAFRLLPAPGRFRGILPLVVGVPAAAVAALLLFARDPGGGAPAPAETRGRHPSVVILAVDSLRADHTSVGGYARDTTPHLAAFARDALTFERARVPAPWTKPSVASTLTGLPPGIHGAEGRSSVLPPAAITLAEILRAAGYETGLFSDNLYVSGAFGLAQGFDHRTDPASGTGVETLGLDADSLLGHLADLVLVRGLGVVRGGVHPEAGALGLLDGFRTWRRSLPAGAPFFAYVHFMEPHLPYSAPAPFDARFSGRAEMGALRPPSEVGLAPFRAGDPLPDADRRALVDAYDAEILYWDDCLPAWLEEIRAAGEDVVVIVTSDHGEGFYEHGTWDHRNSLHEELLHVPLVIRAPGVAARRVPTPVSTLSLFATVLDLAGYAPPGDAPPLVPPPAGPGVQHFRLRFLDALLTGRVEAEEKWILAREGDREVVQCFDLATDPDERTDLASSRPERAAKVREELLRRARGQAAEALGSGETDLSPEADEALRGFGYLK